jgi:hypothetical protein
MKAGDGKEADSWDPTRRRPAMSHDGIVRNTGGGGGADATNFELLCMCVCVFAEGRLLRISLLGSGR